MNDYNNILKKIGFPSGKLDSNIVDRVLTEHGYVNKTISSKLKTFIKNYFQNAPDNMLQKTNMRFLSKLIAVVNPNLNTRNKFFSDTRKFLKNRLSPEQFEDLRYDYTIGKEAYQERRVNHEQRVNDKVPKNINIDEYVSTVQRFAKSNDYAEKMLAVAMATGARKLEILKVTEFSDEDLKLPEEIRIKGIVKRGDAGLNIELVKPVIGITNDVVIKLVDEIRLELGDLLRKMKGNKVPSTIDARISSVSKNHRLEKAFQKSRDGYANVSYELFADKDAITKVSWIKKVLAHKTTVTAVHYNRTNVVSVDLEEKALEEKEVPQVVPMDYVQVGGEVYRIVSRNTISIRGKTYEKVSRKHDGDSVERGYKLAVEMINNGVFIKHKTALRTLLKVGATAGREIWEDLKSNEYVTVDSKNKAIRMNPKK